MKFLRSHTLNANRKVDSALWLDETSEAEATRYSGYLNSEVSCLGFEEVEEHRLYDEFTAETLRIIGKRN